jgi:hypothetical protein
MLDLSKNNPAEIAEAGFEFNIVLPDGTETDAKIKVRGRNSPVVKAHARKVFKELQMKEQAARRRGKEAEDLSLEEAEELAVRNAVVRIISWSGIAEDGKEIAFSKEEAERILTKYTFIREQVMEESDNILNFRHD